MTDFSYKNEGSKDFTYIKHELQQSFVFSPGEFPKTSLCFLVPSASQWHHPKIRKHLHDQQSGYSQTTLKTFLMI